MASAGKKQARLRRARRTRCIIRSVGAARLTVYRSNKHIYAQIFTAQGDQVLAQSSTLDKDKRDMCAKQPDIESSRLIGADIAEKAKRQGLTVVAFDRSGYAYHGRVKALAEAAREAGLEF